MFNRWKYDQGLRKYKFLLVIIICSVPIISVHTVKRIITRRSLGSKLDTNARTWTCNYSELAILQ